VSDGDGEERAAFLPSADEAQCDNPAGVVAAAEVSGVDGENTFYKELTPVLSFLFDDGIMRKHVKSALGYLITKDAHCFGLSCVYCTIYTFDELLTVLGQFFCPSPLDHVMDAKTVFTKYHSGRCLCGCPYDQIIDTSVGSNLSNGTTARPHRLYIY